MEKHRGLSNYYTTRHLCFKVQRLASAVEDGDVQMIEDLLKIGDGQMIEDLLKIGDVRMIEDLLKIRPVKDIYSDAQILKKLIESIRKDVETGKNLESSKIKMAATLVVEIELRGEECFRIQRSLSEALIWATRSGVLELIKLLCTVKNINLNYMNYQTALMVAAESGRLDIIELLLSCGADPTLKNYRGETAFTIALMGGHIECAQFLFDKNKPSVQDLKPSEQDLKRIIRSVVEKGRLDFQKFLAQHSNFNKIRQSLMESEVYCGNTKIVQFLIDRGADVNGLCDEETPLLKVALSECSPDKRLEMVMLLVEKGAHVNRTLPLDSPLLTAIRHKCEIDVVRCLLKNGADVNEVGNEENDTPLTYVIRESSHSLGAKSQLSQILNVLLEAKADLKKCGPNGDTPLHLALKSGDPEIVKQLIEACANLEKIGLTPLLQAVRFRAVFDVISVLKGCGANMKALNNDGYNVLMLAVGLQHGCEDEKTRELLLVNKDQVNSPARDGQTPLMVVARDRNKEAIAFLLEFGADPHLCDNQQQTALEILLTSMAENAKWVNRYGHSENEKLGVKSLIKHGALQSLTKEHYHSLYRMIKDGDRELVQLLVTKGMAPICLDFTKFSTELTEDVSESVRRNLSPLAAALLGHKVVIARFLLDNWFLTPCDVAGSTQIRDIRAFLSHGRNSTTLRFLDEHFSQPMRLEQLSFVAVSAQLGEGIGREERVRQLELELPGIMQDILLFKNKLHPMDFKSADNDNSNDDDDDDYY